VKTQQDLTNEYNIQKKELELLIGTIEKYIDKKKIVKKVEEESIQFMKSLGVEVAKTSLEFETITEKGLKLSGKGFLAIDEILQLLQADFFDVRVAAEKLNEELKNTAPISVEIKKTGADFNKELFANEDKERAERLKGLAEFAQNSNQIFEGIYNVQVALREREFQDLEEQKDKGLISEEQYQERLKKLKQKAAEDNKKAALFSATLSAAAAIINALNTIPPTAIPAAVALASVLSALNIARIAATPIPQFKEGTLNVGRGKLDSHGGMHAIIHEKEAIIPREQNEAYHPTIKAIFHKQIKASEINAFVQNKLSGKMNHNVNAKINTKELARAFDGKKTVDIGNSKALGNIIADRLTSNLKRRQW